MMLKYISAEPPQSSHRVVCDLLGMGCNPSLRNELLNRGERERHCATEIALHCMAVMAGVEPVS